MNPQVWIEVFSEIGTALVVQFPRLATVEAELEIAAAGHVVAALRALHPVLALGALLAVLFI